MKPIVWTKCVKCLGATIFGELYCHRCEVQRLGTLHYDGRVLRPGQTMGNRRIR